MKNPPNYARFCRVRPNSKKWDLEPLHKLVFETRHAVFQHKTYCGKELNEMWWIDSNAGLSAQDVTCKKCRKEMK